jgi:ribosomal protein S12 methylthiotransferase accessory factor
MEMEISFPGGKRVDARYKGFNIATDQPEANGGEGSAPSPFDLFMASIGTCAGIYVLSFCRNRDIPTDRIRIVQTMERNAGSKMIERISIVIKLPTDFPSKYRNAVAKSAEQCTVKKHLAQPPALAVSVDTADAQ